MQSFAGFGDVGIGLNNAVRSDEYPQRWLDRYTHTGGAAGVSLRVQTADWKFVTIVALSD